MTTADEGSSLLGAFSRFLAEAAKPKCATGAGAVAGIGSYDEYGDGSYINESSGVGGGEYYVGNGADQYVDAQETTANVFDDSSGTSSSIDPPTGYGGRFLAGEEAAYGDDGGCSSDGGAGGYGYALDYTVLSVAMWTLALVLVVEIGRHEIDKKAHNRAFLRTVLEGMYRELTTLGIVEFALFLFQTYMESFDTKIYKIFSKVHFLLFFAAVINALMSVVLALLSSRISDRMWVRTEELELNHYIAIREEFERVDAALKKTYRGSEGIEYSGVRLFCRSLRQRIRYPLLKRKYDRLIVQVRFHELRIHFLQANDLPPKFRVSEYLKKSELHVFKKMVHISTFAWITVASFVNLLYFLMGITAYVTSSEYVVGLALGSIYSVLIAIFVPMAWVIEWKMTKIFRQIMQMKLIDLTADVSDDDSDSSSAGSYDQAVERHRRHGHEDADRDGSGRSDTHQLDLFWGGDPNYIIGAFQFMQLGYAIAASVLLIFWGSIQWVLVDVFFVVLILACYAAFVLTMAQVLPRYTLCTSLGQLVNKRRLQETMANFRLGEAKRKRRHRLEEEKIDATSSRKGKGTSSSRRQTKTSKSRRSTEASSASNLSGVVPNTISVASTEENNDAHVAGATSSEASSSEEQCRMSALAKLVQTPTSVLQSQRDLMSPSVLGKSAAELRSERRKNRVRSMSDGVQMMRQIGGSMANLSLTPSTNVSDAAANELNSSASSSDKDTSKATKGSRTLAVGTAAFPTPVAGGKATAAATAEFPAGRASRSGERRRLRKTQSDMGSMRASSSGFFGAGPATSSEETKEEETVDDTKATLRQFSVTTSSSIGANRLTSDNSIGANNVGITSKPVHKSASGVFRSESGATLSSLVEDIPSWSCGGEDLSVPLGRRGSDFCEGEDYLPSVEATPAAAAPLTVQAEPVVAAAAARLAPAPADEGGNVPKPEAAKAPSNSDDDDDDTINSSTSDHTGTSDFDDVPEIAHSDIVKRNEPIVLPPSRQSRLRAFFLSSQYRTLSGTFGTMICFFIVGMRVEIMLVDGPNEIISDNKNTWHLSPSGAFYWEVAWLAMFLAMSLLSSTVFTPQTCDRAVELAHKKTDAKMTVAIASDLVTCGVCLVCLLWAEYSRPSCCQTQEGADVCYEFGSRLCGGLGPIEPWTSIIALRVLRFAWGRHAIWAVLWFRRWQQARKHPQAEASDHNDGTFALGQLGHLNNTAAPPSASMTHAQRAFIQENHMPHSLENESGTIVELWKLAISMYPDIVEKHGEFSGQMLQAMLGVEIAQDKTLSRKNLVVHNVGVSAAEPADTESPGKDHFADEPLATSSRSPEDTVGATAVLMTSPAALKDPSIDAPTSANELKPQPLLASVAVQAEPNRKTVETETDDESLSMFLNPNARLIRSMRRCERRLPPMLDKWAVVDVVITKDELVYFDARDANDFCDSSVKEALFATKGGKGLRLRDVAVGRKVVGHLEINDIDLAKVECLTPMNTEAGWFVGGEDAEEEAPSSDATEEYWKGSVDDLSDAPRQSRNQRWKHVTEHRLKLHSVQGPLYLRFYSDLEDAEKYNPDDEASVSHIHKNDTLLWCQTVARLCGSAQLHQDLAHLGELGSAELRDFIEDVDRSHGGEKRKNTPEQVIRKAVGMVHLPRRPGHGRARGAAAQGAGVGGSGREKRFDLAVIEEGHNDEEDTPRRGGQNNTTSPGSGTEKGSLSKEEETSVGLV